MKKILYLLLSVCFVTGLQAQETYTFTNAGAEGSYGPTQSQINTAYTGTNLEGLVTINSTFQGIQEFTIPSTGEYRIQVIGATGGNQNEQTTPIGRPANISGDFTFTAGQKIKILVGQHGHLGSTRPGWGGGGGTFVALANTPLIVAGGAGSGHTRVANVEEYQNASTINTGQNGSGNISSWENGFGAIGGNGGDGAGFFGNGTVGNNAIFLPISGTTVHTIPQAFINGGAGDEFGGGFGGGGGVTNTWGGGAGGYSGGSGPVRFPYIGGGGGSFNSGSNQVNILNDNDLYTMSHGIVIITSLNIDDTPPVLSGVPAALSEPVSCDAVPAVPNVTANDDMDGAIEVTFTETRTDGACANEYTLLREWSATDAAGNAATASQTINVVDKTAPTLTGVPTETLVVNTTAEDAVSCGVAITFPDITATDNCHGAVTLTYKVGETPVSSGDVFNLGTTNITVTATDVCGNEATESFDIKVDDAEDPVFLDVPATITVANDDDQCSAFVADLGTPVASDNCSVEVSNDAPADGIFPLGTTTVTWTAIDPTGNTVTATQNVIVEDQQAPVFSSFPEDITVTNDAGVCGATVTFALPEGADNCIVASLTQTDVTGLSSGSVFPVGTTTLTYTVTDEASNTLSRDLTITVTDIEGPVIEAPISISVNNDAGACGAIVTFDVTATDNCDGRIPPVLSHSSGSFFPVGITTVIVNASDNAGNAAPQESFTVTVNDTEGPTVVTKNISVSLDALGNATITAQDVDDGSSDNCSFDLSLDITSFSCADLGANTVMLTATDDSGNLASVTTTVTIVDDIAPEITAPSDITVANDEGLCGAVVSLGLPVTSDNCTLLPATNNAPSDGIFPVGSTTVTWTVEDESGNANTAYQTVTVTNAAPIITAISVPTDPVAVSNLITASVNYSDNNISTATFEWGDGGSTVEGPATGPTGTLSSSYSYAMPGVYTLSVTLEDECGETVSTTFQYIVIYDPSGGFVTGNGWIDSPAGASVEYPDAVGKAIFGFVSKYKKGANVPTGNTVFQFKAGNLRFKSTSYEWLVVAGDKAKFKGEGIINGGGSYGFMLNATDGSPDLFRIKIWDKGSDMVVYDNQIGSSDDSSAGTSLGGGSIVVHDGNNKNARTSDISKNEVSSPDIFNEESGSFSFSYKAYPNPVLNELKVQISSIQDEEISFRVYDLVGRVLHDSRHTLQKGKNQIELNTSYWQMAKGKLIFQIQSPSQGVHWLHLLKE